MLHYARSPSSSPARKRQRLSSPTYDEQVGDISEEHLEACDLLEARLSQATSSQEQHNGPPPPLFNLQNLLFTTASALKLPVASSSRDDPFDDEERELAEKEKLYASFLESTTVEGLPTFQSAKSIAATFSTPTITKKATHSFLEPVTLDALPVFRSAKDLTPAAEPLVGFRKASNKENEGTLLLPSKDALRKAQLKMESWQKDWGDLDEVDDPDESLLDVHPLPLPTPSAAPTASFQRASLAIPASQLTPSRPPTQNKPFQVPAFKSQTPAPSQMPGLSQLPFKVPTLSSYSTPLRPHQRPSSTPGPSTPGPSTPGPSTQSAKFGSAPRSIGLSKKSRSTFKTPFRKDVGLQPLLKQNMLTQSQSHFPPATPLSQRPGQSYTNRIYPSPINAAPIQPPQFDSPIRSSSLAKPVKPSRTPLSACGLRPQEYEQEELSSMGLNPTELSQISPSTALHYGFYSSDSMPSPTPGNVATRLNAEAAYQELLSKGCYLATKPWVDNHWCLILWKLAGMAAMDPTTEQNPEKKRWCWAEVMRQLTYRYRKELDGAQRPALRRIVASDSPPGNTLVLCVSAINWIDSSKGAFPELEVTDGWYRIGAQIDPPMARAVRKGLIRVGRKIVTVGAKLHSEKKDPMEILEATDSIKLVLSGNSTHLAPWHAKLGFQQDRYISTMRSLSPDGGLISCIDVEILKVHPIAYLEFVEVDGQQIREGPRNAADEAQAADKWMKRREKEATKLRYEYEKQTERYLDYIQRLEGKVRSYRCTDDDGPPDSIDSYFDDLEDHQTALRTISQLRPSEAYWLIKAIQQNLANEGERQHSEVEKELAVVCPPRNVRNFRVLVVRDARTGDKPSSRVAQLTVWDVESLVLSEGGQLGSFQVGQRFMISNLIPTQMNAWMRDEPGAEIYMAARKSSKWLRIRQT